jgi:hypothetical protein
MKVGTYKGYEILLNAHRRFVLAGGETLNSTGYASFDEATIAIDAAEKTAIKAKAANLALPVLKHDGSGTTEIKGIHQRESSLLFTDGSYSKMARESYGPGEVYPPVDWIKDRLTERAKLTARITEINRELHPVRIKISRGYGGFKTPEHYEQGIISLRAEYETACKLALEHSDAPPLNLSD